MDLHVIQHNLLPSLWLFINFEEPLFYPLYAEQETATDSNLHVFLDPKEQWKTGLENGLEKGAG